MRHCPIQFGRRPKGHLRRAANNQPPVHALYRSAFRSAHTGRTFVACGEMEVRRRLRSVVVLRLGIPAALQSCCALLNFEVSWNARRKVAEGRAHKAGWYALNLFTNFLKHISDIITAASCSV